MRRMVSDASKKAAQKKAAVAAKRGGKAAMSSKAAAASNGVNKSSDGVGALTISDRTCTGVICSHLQSRDIHVVKPRPLQVASIPGLLGMFQNDQGGRNMMLQQLGGVNAIGFYRLCKVHQVM